MGRVGVLLGILASLITWAAAQPRGACTRDIDTERVVDMCEEGNWTLGRVYISISSTTMGDNSTCNCTLRGRTPGQNTATEFRVWQMGNSTEDCTTSHVTMVGWPPDSKGTGGGSQNFTCGSGGTINSPPLSTVDVYLTQLRSDPATIFSYCLHVQPHVADSNLELVCQGEGTGTFTSAPASSGPSTASTSSSSMPSSSSVTSLGQHSGSAGSQVTDDVTSVSTTRTPGAGAPTSSPPFPAVVGGIVGSVALIVIIVIIVVIICKRRARTSKPSEEGRPGVPSAGSEDVLIDNILIESSSAHAKNQPLPPSQSGPTNGRRVFENVTQSGEGPSVAYSVSGNLAMVSSGNASATTTAAATAASVTAPAACQLTSNEYAIVNKPGSNLATVSTENAAAAVSTTAAAVSAAAARQPTSDEYAVVNKPRHQKKPSDSRNAAVTPPSTKVTLPSGDVYAVVDKSRTPRQTPPSPLGASSLPAETGHTTC